MEAEEDYFEIGPLDECFGIVDVGRSLGYEKVKAGLLPSPIIVGARRKGIKGEFRKMRRAYIAGLDEDAQRRLVQDLIEFRKTVAP